MCGGIVAALIYDILQYPRMHNFRTRLNVLRSGVEEENDGAIAEATIRPGPNQWPKQWKCSLFTSSDWHICFHYYCMCVCFISLIRSVFVATNKDCFSSCQWMNRCSYIQERFKVSVPVPVYIKNHNDTTHIYIDLTFAIFHRTAITFHLRARCLSQKYHSAVLNDKQRCVHSSPRWRRDDSVADFLGSSVTTVSEGIPAKVGRVNFCFIAGNKQGRRFNTRPLLERSSACCEMIISKMSQIILCPGKL